MTIADDFSVAVNGDIRYTGASGGANYTVLAFHRFLQDLADDAQASGDDLVDITSDTPSDRSTDNIITLLGNYNIDDDAAQHLYAGSITQASGATVYSGLRVLGAVNNTSTQLMIIQDNDIYQFTPVPAAPFWQDQSAGGYNGDAANQILMRVLVKSRVGGVDIDVKKIRVQARHWGDTYDFFNVTLGQGESVAAIGTTADPQNDTAQATVTAYADVLNSGGTANDPTGGFQLIDLNNGAGNREYYSKWTYGAQGDGLKALYEYLKDLSGNGTSKTTDGLNGELILGITHSIQYDGESSGPFTEREVLAWGTEIVYDGESGGPFTLGERVTIGSSGAGGKLVYLNDFGLTGVIKVALDNTAITILDDDVITGLSSTATADATAAISDNDKQGGTGLLLGLDDDGATGNLYVQLLTGVAPVDDLEITGQTSSASALTNTAPTPRTVPKMFLGSYTGNLIGAYGIGVDKDDLSSSDSLEDLSGATQTPPNNVTFSVTGLISSEDYVHVGPRQIVSGAPDILDKAQDTIAVTLSGAAEIAVVMTTAIPTDTPSPTGTIRIQLDTGIFRLQAYTSYAASTYTIAAADYTDPADATTGNDQYISYIDTLAGSDEESFTGVYTSDRDLFVRVRDGGGTPIKTFESPATFGSANSSIAAIRQSDA